MAIIADHYLFENFVFGLKVVLADRVNKLAFSFLMFVLLLGIFGPELAPYDYQALQYSPNGDLLRLSPPSLAHPMGTTQNAYDVLSRLMYGARPTVITGILGGTLIVGIGATIGISSGYIGGTYESILMRLTDFWYSIPLIPFALLTAAVFGIGFWTTIFVIGIVLWRGNARLLRSQVLQIKERPYVRSAQAYGASVPRIIVKHIIPNTAGMVFLYFALGIGWSIITQAALAFIGVSNPFVPSWGVMIRNAYDSGMVADAVWWALPPGILISGTVLCTFLVGRGVERLTQRSEIDASTDRFQ